jgi:hypothetical protein
MLDLGSWIGKIGFGSAYGFWIGYPVMKDHWLGWVLLVLLRRFDILLLLLLATRAYTLRFLPHCKLSRLYGEADASA